MSKKPDISPPLPFDPEEVRRKVQHLIEAENPDPDDPYFELWVKYCEWEEAQWKKRSDYRSALAADRTVPMQQAQRMYDIGRLEAEEDDYMLIHTREALRLFIGRGADPDGKIARIPGAKTAASILRLLWIASDADNPYADWALLSAEAELDERIRSLETARDKAALRLKALEQRGLHISVLRSSNPVKLGLGFKSPYGFLVAQLVVTFDAFVRVIKTLQARDLLSSEEARIELRKELRPLRTLFDQVLRQQSLLIRPAFSTIKRTDFASKSKDVRQRLAELETLWPGLPQSVIDGSALPRHVRRARVSKPAPVESSEVGELL